MLAQRFFHIAFFTHLALLLTLPASADTVVRGEMIFSGVDGIVAHRTKVRDIMEIKREPLFDNAPFLRLRPGDKLVKARRSENLGKVPPNPGQWDYYLCSGEQYIKLWTTEENGRLMLSDFSYAGQYGLIFDWDFSLANASALRQLLPREYTVSLTLKQRDAMIAVVREEFPDARREPWTNEQLAPEKDQVISIPGHAEAHFQGLAFDSFFNRLILYTVRVSPQVFSIHGLILLQGPKNVERREFEERKPYKMVPNSPGPLMITPEKALAKKAEYERCQRFRELIAGALAH